MTFDDIFEEFIKPPKDLKEAEEQLRKMPTVQDKVAEMAFRQTVINILILSGAVKENDLNASLKHFEDSLYQQFAKDYMELCEKAAKKLKEVELEDEEEIEEDDEVAKA